MSSNTTTTQSQHWILDKFSRSHPVNPSKARLSGKEEENIEWEHYNQQQLHLQIDTISTINQHSTSRIKHIQLTVTFEPLSDQSNSNNFHNMDRNRNRIILTSIDLCSFSSPELISVTPKDQLPVKAVFKALVTGFRYLSISRNNLPEFKRFQMRLANVDDMNRLVKTISSVCPIKAAATTTTNGNNSKLSGNSKDGSSNYDHSTTKNKSSAVSVSPRVVPSTAINQKTCSISSVNRSKTGLFTIPTLFPNLIASMQLPIVEAPSPEPSPISNFDLAKLDEDQFDQVLEDILQDDGFIDLVERVQSSLTQKLSHR